MQTSGGGLTRDNACKRAYYLSWQLRLMCFVFSWEGLDDPQWRRPVVYTAYFNGVEIAGSPDLLLRLMCASATGFR